MRILLTVDPELPVPPGLYGGIERIVDVLVNAFISKGHAVTLCANPESKVPCRLVGWKGNRSRDPVDTLKNIITLTSVVFKGRFDVVHSFGRLIYMLPLMPFRIPKIMSYQREPSLGQIAKAKQLSKKGSMIFTGCSNYITDQIKQVAEAYTIYNCAPVEKYTCTEAVAEDAPLVFLGRIEEIKGTHIAIEVARKTNKRLIIAGNIPEGKKEYFIEKVKPHLNDRIEYVGPVNDDRKNEILGKALAFLMPVQWNEPFGIVMAEAMACGTPVLGFPLGSLPEVITNGVNGFVCADAKEMEEKIGLAATIDRKKVRKIAEEKFSNIKIASDYLALYSKNNRNAFMSLIQKLLPASAKDYLRRKSGVPDMFYSLERLKLLGFDPKQIVDVGAYEGEWTKNCIKIFPQASYLMIEAMPQKESKLQNIAKEHSNVQFEVALLAAKDNMELSFSELETASSVFEEKVAEHQRVKRKAISLVTILRNKGVSKVDLVKLDVQGYELEILKGYGDYIDATEVILAEASLLDIHKGTPLVRDVINFMYDHRFVMYDICSVSTRRPLDNALWQTDLLFVKEDSRFRSDKRYNA